MSSHSVTPAIAERLIAPALRLRLLHGGDAPALLQFEQENRAWFERFIASRGDFFYWPDGIAAHIAHCLDEFAQGRMQPMLLLDQDQRILGRANLHQITPGDAKLGYRLAQHACGRGLAQACVAHLIEDARRHWHLPQLRAFVLPENLASVRVLQKSGFLNTGRAGHSAQLTTGEAACDAYLLRLRD